MPSSTKVLASLLAPAMMVAGLPVVPVQRTGSVVGGTDIAIFANAFVSPLPFPLPSANPLGEHGS